MIVNNTLLPVAVPVGILFFSFQLMKDFFDRFWNQQFLARNVSSSSEKISSFNFFGFITYSCVHLSPATEAAHENEPRAC